MGKHSKKAHVGSYTRTVNGRTQTVKSHKRTTTWGDAKKAGSAAGASGVVFLATVAEVGFEIATAILVALLAVIGAIFGAKKVRQGAHRGKGKGRSSKKKPGGMFTCRTCKKPYNNLFSHTCRMTFTQYQKARKGR